METPRNGVARPADGDVGVHLLGGLVAENRLAVDGAGDGQLGALAAAPSGQGVGVDDEWRTLRLVRRSRTAAVWLTVGIASVSFVLSFNSLRSLAAMTGVARVAVMAVAFAPGWADCSCDSGNCVVGAVSRSVPKPCLFVDGAGDRCPGQCWR